MPATKTHPACNIHEERMWLPLWLDFFKKTVTYAKISPKVVNPGDIAGNAEEEDALLFLAYVNLTHNHIDHSRDCCL